MKDPRPLTIFIDIDGTMLYHYGNLKNQFDNPPKILPGVLEKLNEWDRKGYKIIVTTGRKESHRKETETQLKECGIFYDHLLMGLTGGYRVLINDQKPNDENSSVYSFCIKRNEGLGDLPL